MTIDDYECRSCGGTFENITGAGDVASVSIECPYDGCGGMAEKSEGPVAISSLSGKSGRGRGESPGELEDHCKGCDFEKSGACTPLTPWMPVPLFDKGKFN